MVVVAVVVVKVAAGNQTGTVVIHPNNNVDEKTM